jgi:hypothetical protein
MKNKIDGFENYDKRKGLWFWMMLSIGGVISEEPELSAKTSDHIVDDFIKSAFYQTIFLEDLTEKALLHGKHDQE